MTLFRYTAWDGSDESADATADEAFDRLAQHLLAHGRDLLRALDDVDPEDAELLEALTRRGLLERDREGRFAITPRGIRRCEERALESLMGAMGRGSAGAHPTRERGTGEPEPGGRHPYQWGEPVDHIVLDESMGSAIRRQGPGTPVRLTADDFVVEETKFEARCATVLLLDMSGSMARYDKFLHAKQIALGLAKFIEQRYPQDSFQVVGFSSTAERIARRDLLLASPKRVSLFDPRVFLRFKLEQLPRALPEHFTNLQVGIRLARHLLRRQACPNAQIVCITDGEPTAHVEGKDLLLIYPPSERTARATLAEAARAAREGIHISTFALVEDDFYLELVNFVRSMAVVTRGAAAYGGVSEMGSYVLESFAAGRHTRRIVR